MELLTRNKSRMVGNDKIIGPFSAVNLVSSCRTSFLPWQPSWKRGQDSCQKNNGHGGKHNRSKNCLSDWGSTHNKRSYRVPPKTAIPWHEHLVPMYAYILEGEIEVDYGDKGIKTIKNGETMIEAVNFPHKGINKTKKTAKILVVYVGATGAELEKVIDKN